MKWFEKDITATQGFSFLITLVACVLISLGEHSLKLGDMSAIKLTIHVAATSVVIFSLFAALRSSVLPLVLFSLFLACDLFSRLSYDAAITISIVMSVLGAPKTESLSFLSENVGLLILCILPILALIFMRPIKLNRLHTRVLAVFSIVYLLVPTLFSYQSLFETNGYQTHKNQARAMRTPESVINLEHVVLDVAWRLPLIESFIGVLHTIGHAPALATPQEAASWSNVKTGSRAPKLLVLVIGESMRADHLAIYGHDKPTTPNLKARGNSLAIYENAYSAGTSTWNSLPKMLTWESEVSGSNLSLVKLAQAAGYKVHWLSNQRPFETWGISVTKLSVEADIKTFISRDGKNQHLDEDLLPYFDDTLQNLPPQNKNLIIVHLYGSHLTFSDRYPARFDQFKENDYSSENALLQAHYDNSILYTDYILSELIAKLEPYNADLLYFSDHGLASKDSDIPLKHDVRTNIALDSLHVPLIATGPNRRELPELTVYPLYNFTCFFAIWSDIYAEQLFNGSRCPGDQNRRDVPYLNADLATKYGQPTLRN